MNKSESNKAIIAIIVVALLAAVGSGGYYLVSANTKKENGEDQSKSVSAHTSTTTDPAPGAANTSAYKDGTYDAVGSYSSPGGVEKVDVKVTLSNGKITASTVTSLADDPTAKQYQSAFIGGYRSLITGKSINDVKLSVVAGSSLTSSGFNDAIEQIKQDAAA